jgi:hypothetical protein
MVQGVDVKNSLTEHISVNFSDINEPSSDMVKVMDNATRESILTFISQKFNVSKNEIKIKSTTGTYKDLLFVFTNFGDVLYRNGSISIIHQYIEPSVNETQILKILRDELISRGIITQSTALYRRNGPLDNIIKLEYILGDDYNFFPHYSSYFYFLKSEDSEGAKYESWNAEFDSDTGEILQLKKSGETTFKNIRTINMAINLLKEKRDIKEDIDQISPYFYPTKISRWEVNIPTAGTLNRGKSLIFYIYDDGTIEEFDVGLKELDHPSSSLSQLPLKRGIYKDLFYLIICILVTVIAIFIVIISRKSKKSN